jgi:hypothetical protein
LLGSNTNSINILQRCCRGFAGVLSDGAYHYKVIMPSIDMAS